MISAASVYALALSSAASAPMTASSSLTSTPSACRSRRSALGLGPALARLALELPRLEPAGIVAPRRAVTAGARRRVAGPAAAPLVAALRIAWLAAPGLGALLALRAAPLTLLALLLACGPLLLVTQPLLHRTDAARQVTGAGHGISAVAWGRRVRRPGGLAQPRLERRDVGADLLLEARGGLDRRALHQPAGIADLLLQLVVADGVGRLLHLAGGLRPLAPEVGGGAIELLFEVGDLGGLRVLARLQLLHLLPAAGAGLVERATSAAMACCSSASRCARDRAASMSRPRRSVRCCSRPSRARESRSAAALASLKAAESPLAAARRMASAADRRSRAICPRS